MMDDTNPFAGAAVPAVNSSTGESAGTETPADTQPAQPAALSPAVERFKSCRWRATPEDGEYCTHRDVLPFAGKEGFTADSWCPDCGFYKLRRTPKKRERVDFSY